MKDGEHYHNQGDPEGKHIHRKLAGIILLAVISAFVAYGVAQTAQTTADNNANITNVFEIVVNNTNLAPSFAGHPVGTGERIAGSTYWANDTPLELFVFAHAEAVGANAEVHLLINDTVVADTSGRPLGGAESSNKTIIAVIPKGANYSVQFFNFHHYEWREYPILSGRNGTLSVNQTFIGSSYNATYDQTTQSFNSNYSAQTFPNSTIVTNNNTLSSIKVNKTGDTMTGLLNASIGITTTMINLTNNSYAYAQNNSNSPIFQAGVFKLVNMTTINNDNLGEYNTTNSSFVAKQPGFYLIYINIVWDASNDGERHVIDLYKNDVSFIRMSDQIQGGSSVSRNVNTVFTPVKISAGDRLQVYAFTSSDRFIQATTSWSVFKVG